MASVKVKFRPSSVNGKEGSIYYQVIHNRAVRQITADLYVHESEWNAGTSSVTAPSQADADRKHHLHIIQKYISRDVLRLENIIRDLTLKGVCSADAIVDGYRKQTSLQSFFNFMDSVIGQLKRQQGTHIGNLCVRFVQLHAFQAEQGYTVGRHG